MKKISTAIILLFSLISCTKDEDCVTINGRVERELTGEGIPNQEVYLSIKKGFGSGVWSYSEVIDEKVVTTDANGNFSVDVKNESRVFVYAFKPRDDNYTEFQKSFDINKEIILYVNKFVKFKIFVKNVNPFNSNDYIYIDFASGIYQNFRTKIENFGIHNTIYSDGNEDTSWKGMNVNSILYYNVPENADYYKIYWRKVKNSIETSGVTLDIPYKENQINEYYFEY